MATKLGLTAKLYYNQSTYVAPTWFDMSDIIRDVTLNMEAGEFDSSTRGSTWRRRTPVLKDASVDIEILDRSVNAGYTALRDAFLNGTLIDVLVLNGDRTVAGNEGLRAVMGVFTFTRNEPLEEGITYSVTIQPALDDDDTAPVWVETPV